MPVVFYVTKRANRPCGSGETDSWIGRKVAAGELNIENRNGFGILIVSSVESSSGGCHESFQTCKSGLRARGRRLFLLSVSLWFTGNKEQGLFVGIWVPSILSFGTLMSKGTSHE